LPFHFFRNMVVSVNYQRLYDFKREFDYRLNFAEAGLDLVQNKQFRQDGSVGALGLAGAIEITPTFSLGATFNIWTDQLFWSNKWDETFIEKSTGTIGGAPAIIDTYIKDEYSQFRGLNANIGLLWNVIPSLTVGAVFKTPFTASVQHKFQFQQTQTLGPPINAVTNNQKLITEDVDLDMPLSYGIGLAWRFSDALTIDADVYRTHWSDYILKDSLGNKFSPITGLPRNLSDVDDTTQFRIGAEYLFIFPNRQLVVPLRGGFFYDPEPGQGGAKDFYGIALGSGLAYKRLIFDVAYNFRWGNDVDTGNLITTSKANVRQHSILASLIIHL
jgi:long-subunit fatty acid transport protein